MTPRAGRALRNLYLLLGLALPLFVLAVLLQAVVMPPSWMSRSTVVTEAGPAGLFQYAVLFLPVLFGGLIHQMILWGLGRRWSWSGSRVIVGTTSLVILLTIAAFGESASVMSSPRSWFPILCLIFTYGLLAQPLER